MHGTHSLTIMQTTVYKSKKKERFKDKGKEI